MEIDHIFICTQFNAVIADILVQNGILEGTPNRHPGQGTANRRFFFHNIFLGFIYPEQPLPADDNTARSTDIIQRLTDQQNRYSPFGVACRPTVPGESAPFPHWHYQPAFLPDNYAIQVGIATSNEPLWFFLDFSGRPDQVVEGKRQPLAHPSGIQELTGIRLTLPEPEKGAYSPAAHAVEKINGVDVIQGKKHDLVLIFDSAKQCKQFSLAPDIPLTIIY